MKRLLLLCSAGAVAAGLAAAPAMAGLAGNTSFSHQLPVHVPQQAKVPQVADDHGDGSAVSLVVPSDAPSPAETHETEPGDDDTPVAGQTEPGDDNGVDQDENPTSATEPEPGETPSSPDATETEHDGNPTAGATSSSSDDGGSSGTSGSGGTDGSSGSGGSDG